MVNREEIAKNYPELDPRSAQFNALKAIRSKKTVTDDDAIVYPSVKDFEKTNKKWLKEI